MLRRTPSAAQRDPFDMVKVSMPVTAPAVLVQGENQISVRPGQMLLYDLGQAYDAVHEQEFSALALTFARDTLPLPYLILRRSLGRPIPIDSGPVTPSTARRARPW